MTRRDFMEIDPARQKLIRFIKAAQLGRYYNPMESVGREAAIETISLVLGEDSLLGALANEVRELREVVNARRVSSEERLFKRRHKVKTALRRIDRPALWRVAQEIGLSSALWSRFLATAIAPEMHGEMSNWSFEDWTNYLKAKAPELLASAQERKETVADDFPLARQIPEEFLEQVAKLLPAQPWPTGVHRIVADQLGATSKAVNAAIQELIRRRRFSHQVDGVVLQWPSEEYSTSENPRANT